MAKTPSPAGPVPMPYPNLSGAAGAAEDPMVWAYAGPLGPCRMIGDQAGVQLVVGNRHASRGIRVVAELRERGRSGSHSQRLVHMLGPGEVAMVTCAAHPQARRTSELMVIEARWA